jgi:hypothetical protein
MIGILLVFHSCRQKERPCGGKKIRAANENRNFTEVFGLCDKKWNCELWL